MKEKKKICFVSLFAYGIFNPAANLKFGGSETQLYFLAEKLAANPDFAVSFIVLDVGQAAVESIDNVNLFKAYKRGGGLVKMIAGFFKLIAALRKADPDIIICRAFGREVGVSALYAKIFGKKLVYCFANDHDADGKFFHGLSGKIFQFGFMNADLYVAQSQFQAAEFKKRFKKKSDKISLIKNSWPAEALSTAEKEFILWVGSSSELKRPDIFLDLAEEFPQEKFVMVIAKSKQDGNKWEDIVNRGNNIGNLRLIESVPFKEIDAYFAKAKVLVSTSSSEGFPNVFLQAARAKTPILSLVVNPDGFIVEFQAGFATGGDYALMKTRLAGLLDDENLRRQMGENAYQYLKQEHDINNNIEKWKKILYSF